MAIIVASEPNEPKRSARSLFRLLGPGLVTGAADDDPSGIATYSQAGAQFGYGLLWTVFLTTPFMIAIQLVSARIGRVTGKGLAANISSLAPRSIVLGLVALLVGANTFNIAADIAAMAESLSLVIGGLNHEHALIFAAASTLLQVFLPYRRYAPFIKVLTLSLFAYVATALTVKVPWSTALLAAVWPSPSTDPDYLLTVVAVLGTTISPYLFFWQASQEVEEMNQGKVDRPLRELSRKNHPELRRMRIDTAIGMIFSNAIAFFVILTTATVLHAHGVTKIDSATQAAEALRPLAGDFTFLLFALGIIGTVLGLVHVLENLSDPSKLGPLISGAFVATLWGVMSANIFWFPLANRLKRIADSECEEMELALEGVMAIQAGSNPRLIAQKLQSMLPPALPGTEADAREVA